MNNRAAATVSINQADNTYLDRSVAYEMINDFGPLAFLEVVYRYQKNMAENLDQLLRCVEQKDCKEILWSLQYIKNCSNQLGLAGVASQCNSAIDDFPGAVFSATHYAGLEAVVDHSVVLLRMISSEMQREFSR